MRETRASTTAMRVAMRRAAHQIFDDPKVFDDPVALVIIGHEGAAQLKAAARKQHSRIARYLRAVYGGLCAAATRKTSWPAQSRAA